MSICAACRLKGHWAGDPECEVSGNVDGKATTPSSSSITPSKGKGKGQKGRDEASDAKMVMTVHHSSGFDNIIEYLPDQEPSHPYFTMVCNVPFECF